MRKLFPIGALTALVSLSVPALAQVNPEDEPIVDHPVAPVAPAPSASPAVPAAALTPSPAPVASPPPPSSAPSPAVGAPDSILVPRAVWEQLLRDVDELKRAKAAAAMPPAVPSPPQPVAETSEPSSGGAPTAPGTRNYLLLPDISYVANARALASTDKRVTDRNTLDVDGEIAVQGYVYPGVKYDTFITANPGQGQAFNIEEGYLTFLGAAKGLDINIGRKFAAFGRTGEQHTHSWLTSDQVLPRQDLVAPENLGGNGIQFNYLLPTPKSFFARASVGAFSHGDGPNARVNNFNTSDPFEGSEVQHPGAGYTNFYTGRLWLGKAVTPDTELEAGLSAARGRTSAVDIVNDGAGNPVDLTKNGSVQLTGVDMQIRKFAGANKRYLLRSEYFNYRPIDLPTSSASGYYVLANYRPTKFQDFGLLLERSGIPTAPGLHESAASLIFTHQFTEQYYARLTATHADRPGDSNANELRLQFVAGLGPHTHPLE